MRYWIMVCLVCATAGGALAADSDKPILGSGTELNTVGKATVRAAPNQTARTLGTVPPNTRIQAIEQKEFWFRVQCEIDGREVTGWVYFTEVTQTLGMSKGQLIEINKSLMLELVKLREASGEKDQALAELRVRMAELQRLAEEQKKALDKAQKTIEALKAKAAQPQADKGKGQGS